MSLFITPPGITSLTEQGNDHSRIGDGVARNARMLQIADIERAIRQLAPLPIAVDVASPEPPYFNYFTYCDVLGGVLLQAGSAEIAARVVQRNLNDDIHSTAKFNQEWVFDKYALSMEPLNQVIDKVILLPGSNLLPLIDQSKLVRLVNDEWFIKPHPVTAEPTIRELGRHFGYTRLFNHLVSGYQLFQTAEQIATTQASEFFILAALCKKPMVDLTKYEYSWTTAYQSFAQCVTDDLDQTQVNMERALMHPNSGWIHSSMSPMEIDLRVRNYCTLAMELRKPFKMVSTQVLGGRTNHIRPWDAPDVPKQGPRQSLE